MAVDAGIIAGNIACDGTGQLDIAAGRDTNTWFQPASRPLTKVPLPPPVPEHMSDPSQADEEVRKEQPKGREARGEGEEGVLPIESHGNTEEDPLKLQLRAQEDACSPCSGSRGIAGAQAVDYVPDSVVRPARVESRPTVRTVAPQQGHLPRVAHRSAAKTAAMKACAPKRPAPPLAPEPVMDLGIAPPTWAALAARSKAKNLPPPPKIAPVTVAKAGFKVPGVGKSRPALAAKKPESAASGKVVQQVSPAAPILAPGVPGPDTIDELASAAGVDDAAIGANINPPPPQAPDREELDNGCRVAPDQGSAENRPGQESAEDRPGQESAEDRPGQESDEDRPGQGNSMWPSLCVEG